MDDRLFSIEDVPEVPLVRPSRRRKGEGDARFRNDYPQDWDRCTTCEGHGRLLAAEDRPSARGIIVCPACLGMGSLKARVRLEAGHRCIRCGHPYMPQGDAKMLGVEPSGMHDCETCEGSGELGEDEHVGEVAVPALKCPDCKGKGKVWTPWSACDEQCTHSGRVRVWVPCEGHPEEDAWTEITALRPVGELIAESGGQPYEAEWRILTVHHLSGDKSDCRWGNLLSLCQRCHLRIQSAVVLERVYPHEHSAWFKPHAAWWYALSYLNEDLSREEVEGRMDELLALERVA